MSVLESLPIASPVTKPTEWLRTTTINWPAQVCQLLDQERSVVRVLLVEVRGSAPREVGTCMLIGDHAIYGTIGGGALEQHAVDAAHALLNDSAESAARLQRLVLGTQLGQCCGGVVQVWIEKMTRGDVPLLRGAARAMDENLPTTLITTLRDGRTQRQLKRNNDRSDDAPPVRVLRADDVITLHERIDNGAPPVWIYGAGHVGQALVRALADLPLRITWLDSRADVFPFALPAHIRARPIARPVESVREAPAGTRFLVLTHDHALDYDLCRAILERNEFAWLGLIGSKSKGARFRARLAREAVAPESIARMICPIGVSGIASKWPAAIAIGVAAQLLQTLPAPQTNYRLHAADHCSVERCSNCASHRGSHLENGRD